MSDAPIPIVRPALPDFDEIEPAFREIFASGQITTGLWTRRLEDLVSERLGVADTVAFNSGTSALILALRALQKEPNKEGEVITSPFTWTASAHSIAWNGLTPVFVDIDPHTLTLDPQAVRAAIRENTVGIMPVNVFGVPPDTEAFAGIADDYDLRLVYDSAQGLGSSWKGQPVGGFGHAEIFSMSPTKVVTGIECGLVTTMDRELAATLRSLRDYGKDPGGSGDVLSIGLSARVPELNACVGYTNMQRLDTLLERRRQLFTRYSQMLSTLPGVRFQQHPEESTSTNNYFVLLVEPQAPITRDALHDRLAEQGIQTKKYFWPALHMQAAYRHLRKVYEGHLPHAEAAASAGLALPLFDSMTEEQLIRVVRSVREAFGL